MKFYKVSALVLLSALLLFACSNESTEPVEGEPASETSQAAESELYMNTDFGFSFELPAGWIQQETDGKTVYGITSAKATPATLTSGEEVQFACNAVTVEVYGLDMSGNDEQKNHDALKTIDTNLFESVLAADPEHTVSLSADYGIFHSSPNDFEAFIHKYSTENVNFAEPVLGLVTWSTFIFKDRPYLVKSSTCAEFDPEGAEQVQELLDSFATFY
jgi:hypothetical protein